jgi:hypothetical protein
MPSYLMCNNAAVGGGGGFWPQAMQHALRARTALPLLLAQEIDGFGFALACNFLRELGYETSPSPTCTSGRSSGRPDFPLSAPREEYGACGRASWLFCNLAYCSFRDPTVIMFFGPGRARTSTIKKGYDHHGRKRTMGGHAGPMRSSGAIDGLDFLTF